MPDIYDIQREKITKKCFDAILKEDISFLPQKFNSDYYKCLSDVSEKIINIFNNSSNAVQTNTINLNNGWDFKKYGDTSTVKINLPHQYDNPRDRSSVLKGKTIYSKNLFISDINKDSFKYYLQINSASFKSEIFVNDISILTHNGSYENFFADVTSNITSGTNTIRIEIDNSNTGKNIIPLEADFSFVNGIFRDVNLIKLSDVYYSFDVYGSTRTMIETSNITVDSADLKVKTVIKNISGKNKNLKVVYSIFCNKKRIDTHSDSFEMIDSEIQVEQKFTILNPEIWDGLKKGNLYNIQICLYDSEKHVDTINTSTGFRTVSSNKDGFILNGKTYPLRGINRHAENELNGFAITKADHDTDFEMIKELGVNAIRLAHYPQDRYFIDKCNEYGIVIYIEIPWVNLYPSTDINDDLSNNIRFQFKEMIKEYYNYPCICFWGMHNELTNDNNSSGTKLINYTLCKQLNNELYTYAKNNGGNRLVGYATIDKTTHEKEAGLNGDYYGTNVYFGWYNTDKIKNISEYLDLKHATTNDLIIFTEYGAGSNAMQFNLDIETLNWGGISKDSNFSANGNYHPQEYQCLIHEGYLKSFLDRNYINTFAWVFSDFAVSFRNEGSQKALNDKGFVTRDRKIKKDVFYLYKAFLNKNDKFVHINQKDFNIRENKNNTTNLTVYSNCDFVTLIKDNKIIDKQIADINLGIKFTFKDVYLEIGNNDFTVCGYINGIKEAEDKIEVKRKSCIVNKTVEIGMGNTTNGNITYIKNKVDNTIIGMGNKLDFETPYIKINSNSKTEGYILLNNLNLISTGWSMYINGAFYPDPNSNTKRIFSDSNNEILEFYRINNDVNTSTNEYKISYHGVDLRLTSEATTIIEKRELLKLVITFDGKSLKVYINGVLNASKEVILISGEYFKINNLMFGNRYDLSRSYNLKFSTLQFYDGALTQEEINNL
ncbi:glycoside hydrolase family 2 [Clostridium butyricum]|uniref:glycoside hydrolase family 2 n=1 Tax=Clostridium butyricum TaxID=1492 RepID=UPI00090346EC|nr:glycoside hydrolase family 2 [Clostridium butyricum]APF21221.1 glycosyl hydrolases 2 family protein [Clostridium butyricum]